MVITLNKKSIIGERKKKIMQIGLKQATKESQSRYHITHIPKLCTSNHGTKALHTYRFSSASNPEVSTQQLRSRAGHTCLMISPLPFTALVKIATASRRGREFKQEFRGHAQGADREHHGVYDRTPLRYDLPQLPPIHLDRDISAHA